MLPPAIADHLDALLARHPRPLVAIAGPVAGGKTTLAAAIAEAHDAEALSTDEYLPDYAIVPRMERDEPRHADLARLAEDVSSLKAGRDTSVPVWSFFENRRVSERVMRPGRVVVVEGLFALHPDLADLIDLGVFVDGPVEDRRDRFVARSAEGERGFTVEEATSHFDDIAEPTLWRHLPLYDPQADFRLTHDGSGGFRVLRGPADRA